MAVLAGEAGRTFWWCGACLLAVALQGAADASEWSRFSAGAQGWTQEASDPEPAIPEAASTSQVVRPAAATDAATDAVDGAVGEDAPESDSGACADGDRECREELKRLRTDRLSLIDLDIRVGGRAGNDYPCECRLEGEKFQPRCFATTTFTWKAAGYCHKPLYFEQWNLERYGHSHGFIPDVFLSGAHFFVTLPILPYKMGVELPWECVYPLGYYRPGNCAPWTCPAVPLSGRGLALEAATITGAVFLLP